MRARAIAALRRLEDHWLGDLIGVASLFGGGWMLFVIAHVLDPLG